MGRPARGDIEDDRGRRRRHAHQVTATDDTNITRPSEQVGCYHQLSEVPAGKLTEQGGSILSLEAVAAVLGDAPF